MFRDVLSTPSPCVQRAKQTSTNGSNCSQHKQAQTKHSNSKRNRPLPEWDPTISDLSRYKLSPRDLALKKVRMQSHNLESAREELYKRRSPQSSTSSFAAESNKENMSPQTPSSDSCSLSQGKPKPFIAGSRATPRTPNRQLVRSCHAFNSSRHATPPTPVTPSTEPLKRGRPFTAPRVVRTPCRPMIDLDRLESQLSRLEVDVVALEDSFTEDASEVRSSVDSVRSSSPVELVGRGHPVPTSDSLLLHDPLHHHHDRPFLSSGLNRHQIESRHESALPSILPLEDLFNLQSDISHATNPSSAFDTDRSPNCASTSPAPLLSSVRRHLAAFASGSIQ